MEFVFVIAILIMSVVVHEVSHGYMALALGDPTAKYENRLTLNPISHLDPVGSFLVPLLGFWVGGFIIGWARPVPFNPYNLKNQKWGEALVALAGPLSNLALALIFGLILRFSVGQELMNGAFLSLGNFVVLINITLAIFNLIPIPPLDGSKILSSILPYKAQNVFRNIESFGLIFVFIFVFLFWQMVSPFIIFLFKLIVGFGI